MSWRRQAHDLGLVFCGALGTYLVSIIVARALGGALADAVRSWESAAARVALAVLAIDLSRAPALLAVAWLVGPTIQLRPLPAALGLVLLTYLFDLLMAAVLGQLAPLFGNLPVLLCRAAAAALLVWLTALVIRRRQRQRPPRAPS